jgi:hypothetical protein
MRATRVAAVTVALVVWSAAARSDAGPRRLDVLVTESSIRVDGVELRSGPRAGAARYLSLDAAKRVLGPPQDTYPAGLGVMVFAWTDVGVHLQRGFRGSDKGKLFKFQVWLDETYDKNESKHSGKFAGRVRVEGVEITPDTSFDTVRPELEKAGFAVTEHPYVFEAAKGRIRLFTVGTTNRIERVEAWCP